MAVAGALAGAVAAMSAALAAGMTQLLGGGPREVILAGVLALGVALVTLWGLTAIALAHTRMTTVLFVSRERELQAQLESLASSSVQAQDRLLHERRLLQQRLHDGAQVQLSVAGMRLGLIEYELEDADTAPSRTELLAAVRGVQESLDAAMIDIREASQDLAPRALAEGLGAGLTELARGVPLEVAVTCPDVDLSAELCTGLYLIASEAIANVVKHSRAERASIEVTEHDGVVTMVVADRGVGGADPRGSGLLGLATRARLLGGTFHLTSPPGGPTVIRVDLPRRGRP